MLSRPVLIDQPDALLDIVVCVTSVALPGAG